MSLPAGYRSRPATPDNLAAVAGVLIADELLTAGQIVLGEEFVRAEWEHAGFDLAMDASIVTDGGGTIVGYAQATLEDPRTVESWGVVHPDHRGRGIATWLIDRVDRRADELLGARPDGRFRHAIDGRDEAAASILRGRGLRPVRHFWHMEIALDGSIEAGPSAAGIVIDAVAHEELGPVHRVLTEAFAEDWGYRPEPFDRWVEEQTTPGFWLLASDGPTRVGALTASVWEERVWIGEVGVVPSHRGRGIASALLRRAFAEATELGMPRAILSVDAENPTGATSVYERAGMRVVTRWVLWERSVPAPGVHR